MTATEIAQFVLDALGNYAVYFAAGLMLSLVVWVIRKFVKSGR